MKHASRLFSWLTLLVCSVGHPECDAGFKAPYVEKQQQDCVNKGLFCHRHRPGSMGEHGKRGKKGASGKEGARGHRGHIGLSGPMGPQGVQGDVGPAFTSAYAAAHLILQGNTAIHAPYNSIVPLVSTTPPTEEPSVGVSFDNTTHAFTVTTPGLYDIDYYASFGANTGDPSNGRIRIVFTGAQSSNSVDDNLPINFHPELIAASREFWASASGTRHLQRRLEAGATVALQQVLDRNFYYYAAESGPISVAYLTMHKIDEPSAALPQSVSKGLFCHKNGKGPQGHKGKRGHTGNPGRKGHRGKIGPTGPQGNQGLQGSTGPTGPAYVAGYGAAHLNVTETIPIEAPLLVPLVQSSPPLEETSLGFTFDNSSHTFTVTESGIYAIDYFVQAEHTSFSTLNMRVLFTGSQSGNMFEDFLSNTTHVDVVVSPLTFSSSTEGTRRIIRSLQAGDTIGLQITASTDGYFAGDGESPTCVAYLGMQRINL
jgi:hypothetical protein